MNLSHKLQDALEPIHATEEMKQKTISFLHRELTRRQRKRHRALHYAMSCCAVLFLGCGFGGYYSYITPVSYISIDVNPSVELGLNRMDRVVTVTPYNDDGAQLVQSLSLKHKPYTEAVELLLADETLKSYLNEDALLSFTVVSRKKDAILTGIQQCRGYSQSGAQCHSADTDFMEAAHGCGLSFGKYQAFLELAKYDETITPEECKNLSMGQIRDCIDSYTEGTDSTESHGSGGGHGGCGRRYRGGWDE